MSKASDRRRFLFQVGASGVAVLGMQSLVVGAADAADMPPLDPSGPQASALGYVADGTTTDTAKFPRYRAEQECVNCQLYQGDATAAAGGCLLFAGKSVAAKGWCNAWAQKAS